MLLGIRVAGCEEADFLIKFFMAWSPVRRTNAGGFEVDHPGDTPPFQFLPPASDAIVAEIEDERPLGKRRENIVDATIERSAAGEQRQWIEISLHRHAPLDLVAHKGRVGRPICKAPKR